MQNPVSTHSKIWRFYISSSSKLYRPLRSWLPGCCSSNHLDPSISHYYFEDFEVVRYLVQLNCFWFAIGRSFFFDQFCVRVHAASIVSHKFYYRFGSFTSLCMQLDFNWQDRVTLFASWIQPFISSTLFLFSVICTPNIHIKLLTFSKLDSSIVIFSLVGVIFPVLNCNFRIAFVNS